MTQAVIRVILVIALLETHLPLADTEDKRGTTNYFSAFDEVPNLNHTQLTLKIDFSSKVVEHGK